MPHPRTGLGALDLTEKLLGLGVRGLLLAALFGKSKWTPPLLTLEPDTPPEGTPEMRRMGTAG